MMSTVQLFGHVDSDSGGNGAEQESRRLCLRGALRCMGSILFHHMSTRPSCGAGCSKSHVPNLAVGTVLLLPTRPCQPPRKDGMSSSVGTWLCGAAEWKEEVLRSDQRRRRALQMGGSFFFLCILLLPCVCPLVCALAYCVYPPEENPGCRPGCR